MSTAISTLSLDFGPHPRRQFCILKDMRSEIKGQRENMCTLQRTLTQLFIQVSSYTTWSTNTTRRSLIKAMFAAREKGRNAKVINRSLFIDNQVYGINSIPNEYRPVSSIVRLDYQPLFGKGARAPPRTHGWTHGLSIVNFDQWNICLPESSKLHKLSPSQ